MAKLIDGTDMLDQGWVIRYLPSCAVPYAYLARWDRPIGVLLLLFPCFWGILLATILFLQVNPIDDHPGLLFLMGLFTLGAVLMRGAGCTLNDMFDRVYDAKVQRTRMRPLASGQISMRHALVFCVLQAFGGLLILLHFNQLTVILGIASLALVVPYPLMKRITYWPQAWLGLTFNWGVLMGTSALLNQISVATVLLYAACFFWTLGYDTIYAHQDKEDDAMVGVKSSALRLGQKTKPALMMFYGAMVVLLAVCFSMVNVGMMAWGGLAVTVLHLCYQINRLDIDKPDICLVLFKSNQWIGFILTVALSGDILKMIFLAA